MEAPNDLDTRLAHLWHTITRANREIRNLKTRLSATESRLDSLEAALAVQQDQATQ